MSNTDFWGEEEPPRRGSGGGRLSAVQSRQDTSSKRKREKRKRRGGGAAVMAALLFLVVVLGGGGYFGYTKLKNYMQPADYEGPGTGSVTIEVAKGDFTTKVGQTLQKRDVVKSVKAFTQEAGTKLTSLQPGFYKMRLKMSSAAAVARLLDPAARAGVVNIPEGRRAVEVFALLSKQTKIPMSEFMKVRKNPKALGLPSWAKGNLEGYLFPAQYDLPPTATATQLLKMMVDRFKTEVTPLNLGTEAKKVKLTPRQVIIMASLIQAEAGKSSDYPKIARVIYNRIAKPMNLGFDTTILYALNKRTLNVRNHETEINNPYNTYKHPGLTPGPISNPGVAAIKAVLRPANGTWLYFVAVDPTNRITKFGTTDAEKNAMDAQFRAWQKKNPGN
jgi:uncharacterized YceG family protein